MAKIDSIKAVNFIFIWGCRPSTGVMANTQMVNDIFRAFIVQQDQSEASISIPTIFDQLQSSDASFETASSNQLQHLQLYYAKNIVTHSIGIVFYNEGTDRGKFEKKLKTFGYVDNCKKMLQEYIKLDRVHVFGCYSTSQILEKFNWVKQLCLRNGKQNSSKGRFEDQVQTCVVVVSLSQKGMFAETMPKHQDDFNSAIKGGLSVAMEKNGDHPKTYTQNIKEAETKNPEFYDK